MHKIDENHKFILHPGNDGDEIENFHSCHTSVPSYILDCLVTNTQNATGITDGTTGNCTLYKDFERLSRSVASALSKLGFEQGETLIYCSDDAANLHVFLLGVWRANGIIRGSYPEDLGEALVDRIRESNTRWILCDAENAEGVKICVAEISWDVNVIVSGKTSIQSVISAKSLFGDSGDSCPILKLKETDIAAVVPTSGTTGKSKGAVITHGRLLKKIFPKNRVPETQKFETLFHLGKATHLTAILNFEFIAQGRNLVRLRGQDYTPENICRTLAKYKPTEVTLNAMLMDKVLTFCNENGDFEALESLKLVNFVGTSVTQTLISKLRDLPNSPTMFLLYGSTETVSLCFGEINDELFNKIPLGGKNLNITAYPRTGRLASGVRLAVRFEDGSVVGPLTKGELWFKSNHSCIGYYNNVVETDENFGDGWIRTGDLGFYDESGLVYIVGRFKEVFKYKGNHVSPLQIEEVLCRHTAVAEACVVGVIDPDGLGHIAKAFVILKSNANLVSRQELLKFANDRLPSYMQIRGGLEFRKTFPYGPGGKIQRFLLT